MRDEPSGELEDEPQLDRAARKRSRDPDNDQRRVCGFAHVLDDGFRRVAIDRVLDPFADGGAPDVIAILVVDDGVVCERR